MSLSPTVAASSVSSGASAKPVSAAPGAYSPFPNRVVDQTSAAVPPPGDTQTVTTTADGEITTVITNAAGVPVDTIFTTSTMNAADAAVPELSVNVWA
jgi:hypothetical protein